MYIGLHVKKKRLNSCQIVMKLVFSQQTFEKFSNMKFHENPSSESRVVSCGRTDEETDMAKLIGAFRNVANAPKNAYAAVTIACLRVWNLYNFRLIGTCISF